jgi:hypothetical protein
MSWVGGFKKHFYFGEGSQKAEKETALSYLKRFFRLLVCHVKWSLAENGPRGMCVGRLDLKEEPYFLICKGLGSVDEIRVRLS